MLSFQARVLRVEIAPLLLPHLDGALGQVVLVERGDATLGVLAQAHKTRFKLKALYALSGSRVESMLLSSSGQACAAPLWMTR